MLDATAGPFGGGPWCPPPGGTFIEAVSRATRPMHIAFSRGSPLGFPVQEDCQAAVLDARSARTAPGLLAEHGIAGGATYDGLIALAAKSARIVLGTRDRRAEGTYRRLGVEVEVVH